MIELEACNIAAEMLRTAGFGLRYPSMKSEAAYYGWPGHLGVIRVAAHRARRAELNGVPILSSVTFNHRNFKTDAAGVVLIPRDYVIRVVGAAIGQYFLTATGAIRARKI